MSVEILSAAAHLYKNHILKDLHNNTCYISGGVVIRNISNNIGIDAI